MRLSVNYMKSVCTGSQLFNVSRNFAPLRLQGRKAKAHERR